VAYKAGEKERAKAKGGEETATKTIIIHKTKIEILTKQICTSHKQ
jgi:hypothetical protein